MKQKDRGTSSCVRVFALALSTLVLSSCGTQINTLRTAALLKTGALGVPPAVTSLTVTNASPTNAIPLSLSWGLVVGTYTNYCILENSTNSNACIWRTGALPTTYADTAPDGATQLHAFLKNEYGTSSVIDSNAFTIDRLAPEFTSITLTSPASTNSATISLTYGAITNPTYADYCILTNSVVVGSCTWTTGTLPPTYAMTGTDGSKSISFWIRDAAGNVSNRSQVGPVVLDTGIPTLAEIGRAHV